MLSSPVCLIVVSRKGLRIAECRVCYNRWEFNPFHFCLFAGKPELKGYRIAPLSSDEVKVINSFLKGWNLLWEEMNSGSSFLNHFVTYWITLATLMKTGFNLKSCLLYFIEQLKKFRIWKQYELKLVLGNRLQIAEIRPTACLKPRLNILEALVP